MRKNILEKSLLSRTCNNKIPKKDQVYCFNFLKSFYIEFQVKKIN